jgi:hypothetical protein
MKGYLARFFAFHVLELNLGHEVVPALEVEPEIMPAPDVPGLDVATTPEVVPC